MKKNDLRDEETQVKRRTLGNIRFIGELFKLKVGPECFFWPFLSWKLKLGSVNAVNGNILIFLEAFASGKYLAHIQYSEKEMFYCILFAENDL